MNWSEAMNAVINATFAVFFAFTGYILGHGIGTNDMEIAIKECEKELPRNVNCKIIAVPVDKN
jgi:hypothetical protein